MIYKLYSAMIPAIFKWETSESVFNTHTCQMWMICIEDVRFEEEKYKKKK